MKAALTDKIYACLAGGLIGDAMGAPVENWDYHKIQETYGWLQEFSGDGTDDSAIKLILCDAIVTHNGDVTADEFAGSFLKMEKQYYNLFYIPVRNMLHKIQDGLSLPVWATCRAAARPCASLPWASSTPATPARPPWRPTTWPG